MSTRYENDRAVAYLLRTMDRQQAIDDLWEGDADNTYELPERPTWQQVAEREPRVVNLIAVARQGFREDTDSYDFWYREVKPQIEAMVGTYALQPWPLRSSGVYDAVYRYLMHVYETGEVR